MTNRRASGQREKNLLVKGFIVLFLCHKSPQTRDDIADVVIEKTREADMPPIRQRQGIYRHIKELAIDGYIVENKEKTPYSYHLPEISYQNFKNLCEFFQRNRRWDKFIKTDYFLKSFRTVFRDIVKEGFSIALPDYAKLEKHTTVIDSTITNAVLKSETATNLFIFEPKRFKQLKELVKVSFDENQLEKIRKEKEKEVQDELSKTGVFITFLDDLNLLLAESKVLSKNARKKLKPLHDLIEDVTPSLIVCYYIDIFQHVLGSKEEKLNTNYEQKLVELQKNKDEFVKNIQFDLQIYHCENQS